MQFNSPVEVNWDYMDGELLQRFWAGRSAERAGAAPIADRILVFHRGITTVRPNPEKRKSVDNKTKTPIFGILV